MEYVGVRLKRATALKLGDLGLGLLHVLAVGVVFGGESMIDSLGLDLSGLFGYLDLTKLIQFGGHDWHIATVIAAMVIGVSYVWHFESDPHVGFVDKAIVGAMALGIPAFEMGLLNDMPFISAGGGPVLAFVMMILAGVSFLLIEREYEKVYVSRPPEVRK
jgi:hypothetical protein